MNDEKKTDRKERSFTIGAALAVALLMALIMLLLFRCGSDRIQTPDASASPGIAWDADAEEGGLETKSKEEIQAELNEKVAEGMINISMNTSPVFESGTAKGNLLIVNSERNNYPQVVYIVRKDTQEEIYRSGAIPVGSKVEYAQLEVDLPVGTYDCVAYFNNVDVESGQYLGTAGAEIQLTVLS